LPRIDFLFVLIVFLTACTPYATIAPLPTVTSSPVASVAPTSKATEMPSIANPISQENMDLLTQAGYEWDSKAGDLKMKNGYIALNYKDGKWFDTRTDAETAEAPTLVKVDGVDFDGKDIVVIMTREINGETLMYQPLVDAWVPPLDVKGSRELIDRNPIVPTMGEWGSYQNVTFDELPEISWDDFHSGRLFYSEQLALKKWPVNVRVPTLEYQRLSVITNAWSISEYPNYAVSGANNTQPGPLLGGPHILYENDGVRNLDAFKMKDPITGNWLVVKGQQYLYDGHTVVLHLFFGDTFTDPKTGGFDFVQRSLSNPPFKRSEPIVNMRPGDYCLEGSMGSQAAQPSICALLGYDNLDIPRSLLPDALEAMIASYDVSVPQEGAAKDVYPVGNEIYALQQLPLPQYSAENQWLGIYLRHPDDPYFK
jgi:hypothetical protein